MTLYVLDGMSPLLPEGFCFIAPSAEVIGNVVLGKDVGVWFGAVLRGDNDLISIGAGTNIQDMAMVHVDPGYPVVIGENCTIGTAPSFTAVRSATTRSSGWARPSSTARGSAETA